jgi:ABC-type uncharacterized transport system involved in gliding motility auxiliary subunit
MSWATRQTKYGAYSGTYVIVVLAILVAGNYLASRYNKTFDATKDKLFSLSDQTHRILDKLDRDVKIYYFDRKTDFNAARNSLSRYENASHRVSVEYVDVDSRPELAQAMNVRTYGTVIVEVGANREEAKSSEEQEITNSIIRSLKGEEKTACLLTGHGEADSGDSERNGFSSGQSAIEGANYKIQTISLLEKPEIPGECTLLIVAGPDTDYLDPEIDILRKYIEGGGRALLMIDYDKTPNLVALAGSWGIKVNNDVVIDTSGIGQLFGGGPLAPLVAQYESHPITDVMGNTATIFPMTRSVEPGEAPPSGWQVSKLFSTTANSFATQELKVEDGELQRNADKERPGPISVGVAATFDVPAAGGETPPAAGEPGAPEQEKQEIGADKPEERQGRIVVVGTSLFARNGFLGRTGNLDLLLNMLNWLSSDEDLISIRPKDPENTPLNISQSQITRLFWGTVVGLPLLIIFAGVRVWWVRR